MLRRISLLILLLVISKNVFGQDTVVKYLVIDTVIFEHCYHPSKEADRSAPSILINFNSIMPSNQLNEHTPQISTPLRLKKNDSMKIGIIIDDIRSVLWVNFSNKNSDTIHIDKWTLFHNNLPDSNFSSKGYYHFKGDKYIDQYKVINHNYFSGDLDSKKNSYTVKINDNYYDVPLFIEAIHPQADKGILRIHEMSVYEGYLNKNGERKQSKGRKWEKFVYNKERRTIHYFANLYLR